MNRGHLLLIHYTGVIISLGSVGTKCTVRSSIYPNDRFLVLGRAKEGIKSCKSLTTPVRDKDLCMWRHHKVPHKTCYWGQSDWKTTFFLLYVFFYYIMFLVCDWNVDGVCIGFFSQIYFTFVPFTFYVLSILFKGDRSQFFSKDNMNAYNVTVKNKLNAIHI